MGKTAGEISEETKNKYKTICFLGNFYFILKIKTPPRIKDFKRNIIKEVHCDSNIRLSR